MDTNEHELERGASLHPAGAALRRRKFFCIRVHSWFNCFFQVQPSAPGPAMP